MVNEQKSINQDLNSIGLSLSVLHCIELQSLKMNVLAWLILEMFCSYNLVEKFWLENE